MIIKFNKFLSNVRPYVGLPYSYAFGRSEKPLEYLRIGDLISKRAETGMASKNLHDHSHLKGDQNSIFLKKKIKSLSLVNTRI